MNLLESVKNGDLCPFKALSEIKEQIEALELIKKELTDIAISQFDKEIDGNSKSFKKYGKTFTISQTGRYQYNHSKNWNDIKNNLERVQGFMQVAAKNNQSVFVDPETGEVFEAAVYVPSAKSISISGK